MTADGQAPLRVAVANPLRGRMVAETVLEARFLAAGQRLGWEIRSCPDAAAVERFDPEFVLSLHQSARKETAHPWYGCMWHPPAFFGDAPAHLMPVSAYDGYLVASSVVSRWLQDLLGARVCARILGEIHTGVNGRPYQPAKQLARRLLYAGVHWDGDRHRRIFEALDSLDFVDVYGPPEAWSYLRRSYRGVLAFDGVAVIDETREAGAGLCLHHDYHRQAEIPSLRIFEIVASGAITITHPHPFIERVFGGSVLYIDEREDPENEVIRCMEWVRSHPDDARQRAWQAYRILTARYTLELMLAKLPSAHRRLQASLPQMSA